MMVTLVSTTMRIEREERAERSPMVRALVPLREELTSIRERRKAGSAAGRMPIAAAAIRAMAIAGHSRCQLPPGVSSKS